MEASIVKLRYDSNIFYMQCHGFETIEDLKSLLVKKYNFDKNSELEIYQNFNKLPLNLKIQDLEVKDNLRISGSLMTNLPIKIEKEIAPESNENILSKFRTMGFTESEETIMQLLENNDNNIGAVIANLLLKKMKANKK